MNCREAEKLIPLVAGHDATAEENEAVREHAAGCPACAAELAAFERQLALFESAAQLDVPQGLLDGLADKALAEARKPAPRARPVLARLEVLVPVAAAAALLLLVAGYGSGLLQGTAPPPVGPGGGNNREIVVGPPQGGDHPKLPTDPVPSRAAAAVLVQDTTSPSPYALPVLTASTGAVNLMDEAQPSAAAPDEPETESTSYVLEAYDLADDATVSLDF